MSRSSTRLTQSLTRPQRRATARPLATNPLTRLLPAMLLLPMLATGPALANAPVANTQLTWRTDHDHASIEERYAADATVLLAERDASRLQRQAAAVTPRHILHFHDHEYPVLFVEVGASLYADADGDGYFSRFSLSFDADTEYGERQLRARIFLRPSNAESSSVEGAIPEYELFHVTERFDIYDDLASDSYRVESRLVSNYPADHYDVRIDLHDAYDDELLDSVDANSHSTLAGLPLEAATLDDGPRKAIIQEHAGGLNYLAVLLLGAIAMFRRR